MFFSLSRVKEVEMLCGIRVGSGQTREVSHLPSESVRFRIQAQNIEIIWQAGLSRTVSCFVFYQCSDVYHLNGIRQRRC